ncbi:hypothetical protein D3C87_1671270 [compost metagenome]
MADQSADHSYSAAALMRLRLHSLSGLLAQFTITHTRVIKENNYAVVVFAFATQVRTRLRFDQSKVLFVHEKQRIFKGAFGLIDEYRNRFIKRARKGIFLYITFKRFNFFLFWIYISLNRSFEVCGFSSFKKKCILL